MRHTARIQFNSLIWRITSLIALTTGVLIGLTVNAWADEPETALDRDALIEEARLNDEAGSAKARLSLKDGAPGVERASGERLASAIGHYARSRALLLQAIQEFDKARSIAKPDALINSEEWRSTLASRADELTRVMAPQPRVTRSGVRFDAAPQLLEDTDKKVE